MSSPPSRETQWYNSLFKTLSRFLNAYSIKQKSTHHPKPSQRLSCPSPVSAAGPWSPSIPILPTSAAPNWMHFPPSHIFTNATAPDPPGTGSPFSVSVALEHFYSWQELSPCLAPCSGLCVTTLRAGNWLYLSPYFKNLAQWLPLQRRQLVTVSWLKGRTDVNERKKGEICNSPHLSSIC